MINYRIQINWQLWVLKKNLIQTNYRNAFSFRYAFNALFGKFLLEYIIILTVVIELEKHKKFKKKWKRRETKTMAINSRWFFFWQPKRKVTLKNSTSNWVIIDQVWWYNVKGQVIKRVKNYLRREVYEGSSVFFC